MVPPCTNCGGRLAAVEIPDAAYPHIVCKSCGTLFHVSRVVVERCGEPYHYAAGGRK